MASRKEAKANRREELRRQMEIEAAQKRKKRITTIAISVVAALALILGIVWLVVVTTAPPKDAPKGVNNDRNAYVVSSDKTKSDAKTVSIFTDFQCPRCSEFEQSYAEDLKKWAEAGDIKLEFHPMSFLDKANESGPNPNSSSRATEAAMCAAKVGKYDKYALSVFGNQPEKEATGFSEEQLRVKFSEKAGISGDDLKTFQQCYDTHEYKSLVKFASEKNIKLLSDSGAEVATPAMLINGKSVKLEKLAVNGRLSKPAEELKKIIDEAK